MGIEGLWSFLRSKHAAVFRAYQPGEHAGKRFGIDAQLYARRMGDNLPQGFLDMAQRLTNIGVTPVFLFDGPKQKVKRFEHERRQAATDRHNVLCTARRDVVAELQNIRDRPVHEHAAAISAIAARPDLPRDVQSALATSDVLMVNVAGAAVPQTITLDVDVDQAIQHLQGRVETVQNYERHITDTEMRAVIDALDAHGVAFVYARGEGEQLGAQMLRNGEIDVLVTDDGDALPFGATVIMRDLFRESKTAEQTVALADVLSSLQISMEQFVDMAIMCGCDFTEARGLPGVGPVSALKIVREHHTIERYLASPAGVAKLAKLASSNPDFSLDKFQFAEARAVFRSLQDQVLYRSRALDPHAGPTPVYKRSSDSAAFVAHVPVQAAAASVAAAADSSEPPAKMARMELGTLVANSSQQAANSSQQAANSSQQAANSSQQATDSSE